MSNEEPPPVEGKRVYSPDEQFEAAVKIVHNLPKDGPIQISINEKLTFYGLYKQGVEGKCTGSRPAFWNMIERYKWDAWNKLGDMDSAEAKRDYVRRFQQKIDHVNENYDIRPVLQDPRGKALEPLLRECFKIIDRELINEHGELVATSGLAARNQDQGVDADQDALLGTSTLANGGDVPPAGESNATEDRTVQLPSAPSVRSGDSEYGDAVDELDDQQQQKQQDLYPRLQQAPIDTSSSSSVPTAIVQSVTAINDRLRDVVARLEAVERTLLRPQPKHSLRARLWRGLRGWRLVALLALASFLLRLVWRRRLLLLMLFRLI